MNLPPANYWSISRATLKRSLVNLTPLLYALLNQNSISFQNDVVSVASCLPPGSTGPWTEDDRVGHSGGPLQRPLDGRGLLSQGICPQT